jgi:sugar phosphate isomerase/epimerase
MAGRLPQLLAREDRRRRVDGHCPGGSVTRYSHMTLNHSDLFGLDGDLAGQARAAAAAGFPLIGPDVFSLRAWVERGGELAELAGVAAEAGIRWYDLAGLTITDDRDATLRDAEQQAGFVRALGCEWAQVRVPPPVDDAVIATFRAAAELFGEAGAGVTVEYSRFTSIQSSRAARAFVHTADDLGVRTGVVVDSWHVFDIDPDFSDLSTCPGRDIPFIQFDDGVIGAADPVDSTFHHRSMPGDGQFDLDAFVGALRQVGFDGVVTFEVLSDELRALDVGEFARRALQAAHRYWG